MVNKRGVYLLFYDTQAVLVQERTIDPSPGDINMVRVSAVDAVEDFGLSVGFVRLRRQVVWRHEKRRLLCGKLPCFVALEMTVPLGMSTMFVCPYQNDG